MCVCVSVHAETEQQRKTAHEGKTPCRDKSIPVSISLRQAHMQRSPSACEERAREKVLWRSRSACSRRPLFARHRRHFWDAVTRVPGPVVASAGATCRDSDARWNGELAFFLSLLSIPFLSSFVIHCCCLSSAAFSPSLAYSFSFSPFLPSLIPVSYFSSPFNMFLTPIPQQQSISK